MTLIEIIKQQAEFVNNSGITVTVDRAYETVSIDDTDGNNVFLQGDDAREFIERADSFYNDCQHIGMDVAELAAAYDYADILAG